MKVQKINDKGVKNKATPTVKNIVKLLPTIKLHVVKFIYVFALQ